MSLYSRLWLSQIYVVLIKSIEQKYLIYKMGHFRELKNSQNICSFTEINCCEWAKK